MRQEFENGLGQRERYGDHMHQGLSAELASPEMGRGVGGGAKKPACGEWLGVEAGAGETQGSEVSACLVGKVQEEGSKCSRKCQGE